MKFAAAFFVLTAAPLAAQEFDFSIDHLVDCLNRAVTYDEQRICIGTSASICMVNTPGGESTYGMSGCLSKELEYWDDRLNRAYSEVMAEAKRADQEMAEYGASVPSQAEALRDMQRAWIKFRDATCDYERSQWAGGTGGGPATVSCLMTMTGEQTLYLDASRLGG